MTRAFEQRGLNAMVMPAHVTPADLAHWLERRLARSERGRHPRDRPAQVRLFRSVPDAFRSARAFSAPSTRCGATRTEAGMATCSTGWATWRRCATAVASPSGRKALLVGAGGAGSAIAHALVMAGVRSLAIHDGDADRRRSLVRRLAGLDRCPVTEGSADPAGPRPRDQRVDGRDESGGSLAGRCRATSSRPPSPAASSPRRPSLPSSRRRGPAVARRPTGMDMFVRVAT